MRRMNEERGAVAVIVALLLVVLIGMGAVVIDVGALYQERRELQNGADAGALAIAENCVRGSCGATGATAATFADLNSNDLTSAAVVALPGDRGAKSVTVTTTTREANGDTFLTHWLAPVLGVKSTTVAARATAMWGAVSGGPVLPLTFGRCEFDRLVPTGVPSEPGAGTAQILFHDGNPDDPCSGRAGGDFPGSFGWLDPDASGCTASLSVDQTATTDTGNSLPGTCKDRFDHAKQTAAYPDHLAKTVVLIPIFDSASGVGNNGVYHVYGFAEFFVTGWYFGSQYYYPNPKTKAPCGGDQRCIQGYFVRYVDVGAVTTEPAPDLGATTFGLVG